MYAGAQQQGAKQPMLFDALNKTKQKQILYKKYIFGGGGGGGGLFFYRIDP